MVYLVPASLHLQCCVEDRLRVAPLAPGGQRLVEATTPAHDGNCRSGAQWHPVEVHRACLGSRCRAHDPRWCQDADVPALIAAASALPLHRYPQRQITEAFTDVMVGAGATDSVRSAIARTHEATTVQWRHLALPLADYDKLDDFGAANDAFLREAPPLAARAVGLALERAGLDAVDVDLVVSTTVTGVAAPSLDARMMPLLGLRPDVRRMPLVGLGCVAGAAGVARVADHLRG